MAYIVYVEAITKDADIQNKMYPVTMQHMLNTLLSRQPELTDTIEPLEGLGIWTEWADSESVGRFFRGPMHAEFVDYAKGTFNKARYRIVQLDDNEVKVREIPD